MFINGFEIEKYNQYNLPEKQRRSVCPLCSENRKPKNRKYKVLMMDWERGLAHCCHCGENIQLHTYKKRSASQTIRKYQRPTWNNNTELSDNVVKWFESRGIHQLVLHRARISETTIEMPPEWNKQRVVCFNYFRNGELTNVKYRSGDKQFRLVKDAELVLYNLDNCRISKDIIICEGEMDALSYMEAGMYQVVSVPNGATQKSVNLEYLNNCIEYFENKEKIYISTDSDEAGQNLSRELIRRFGSERCYMVNLDDCKDANEFLLKYGARHLRQAIYDAKVTPIEGVSSLADWREDFKHYLDNGMRQGYITGINSFDNIFSTYTGQYIVVTGIPSSGKSDFVDMMCLGYYRNYGWKIALASPENKPNSIHAGKLLAKICGLFPNLSPDMKQEQWFDNALDMIDDAFKFIDFENGYDLEEVLAKAQKLIFRFGIKVLVIDPFNKIRLNKSLGKSTNDYTNDYLIAIEEFARKNDILILLVAHPNKPAPEEKRKYEPDFYSVKGGGEFYDMSPHGILIHQDIENELVKVKVLKVKYSHLGKNNKHVWLHWNARNGRYTDFKVQDDDPMKISGIMIDNTNWATIKQRSDN